MLEIDTDSVAVGPGVDMMQDEVPGQAAADN